MFARTRAIVFACVALLLATVLVVRAGDLNPPPGPITPTMKTLTQVEPRTPVQSLPGSGVAQYVISVPGSYYLTGNIQGVAGKFAISIEADDVSLDLEGFEIKGVDNSQVAIRSDGRNRITCRNGSITSWGWGVFVTGGKGAIIKDLSVSACSEDGINVHAGALVSSCTITDSLRAIVVLRGTITNCSAQNCVEAIKSVEPSIIASSTTTDCSAGIIAGYGSTVRDCHSFRASSIGILANSSDVRNCTIVEGTIGIEARGACHIEGNQVDKTGTGITTIDPGSFVAKNNIVGSTTAPYNFTAGTKHGPMVDISASSDVTPVTNSSHPQANFIY